MEIHEINEGKKFDAKLKNVFHNDYPKTPFGKAYDIFYINSLSIAANKFEELKGVQLSSLDNLDIQVFNWSELYKILSIILQEVNFYFRFFDYLKEDLYYRCRASLDTINEKEVDKFIKNASARSMDEGFLCFDENENVGLLYGDSLWNNSNRTFLDNEFLLIGLKNEFSKLFIEKITQSSFLESKIDIKPLSKEIFVNDKKRKVYEIIKQSY